MRAVVWAGPRDVRVETVPDPSIVNPHDALLRVTATAICDADLHLYRGTVPGVARGDILGHEFVGEVVAVGRACERVAAGDRVLAMCAIACGRCWYCLHALFSACDNANPAGAPTTVEVAHGHAGTALFGYSRLYGGYAGGQAEYVRVPFADVGCVHLPPEVSAEHALLLTDAMPAAFASAESCGITAGDTIAVFGAGAAGQLAARSALLLGAERVIAIDGAAPRLALAAEAGAVPIDDERTDVLERLAQLTGGRGADACIVAIGLDAPGGATALRLAVQACRRGGAVALPAVHGGAVDRFPLGPAFAKGLRLALGQVHYHRYGRALLDRVIAGQLDPTVVITHRGTLADVPRLYDVLDRRADGCIKCVAHV